jgi:hypothetical protein
MEIPGSPSATPGGVPQTTINDGAGAVVSAVPEDYLLANLLRRCAGNGWLSAY